MKNRNPYINLFFLPLLLLFFSINSTAQDFNFSQFYSLPSIINPANTGNISGDYRVGALNKTLGFDGINQYQTVAGFADFALLDGELGRDSWLGLGTSFIYDNAGVGAQKSIKTGVSVAFHQVLSKTLYFSAGLDFAYVRKQIDLTDVYFGSQYEESGLNLNILSGESVYDNLIQYLDVGGGFRFSYLSESNFKIEAGLAFWHLNRPRESVYFPSNVSGKNRRSVRPVWEIKSAIDLDKIVVSPALFYSREKNAQEFIFGSHLAYILSKSSYRSYGSELLFGLWNRWGNAITASVGFAFEQSRILFSYDANIQSLNNNAVSRHGFEISLIHSGSFNTKKGRLYCPRF